MVNKIYAYYPSIFYSSVRKMPKSEKIGKDSNSAKEIKIAERYNSRGIKECFYSSAFNCLV